MRAESPVDASTRWLNAETILDSIEMNEFYYNLPASVKQLDNSKSGGKKRKADHGNENSDINHRVVMNENPVEAWKLRDGEDYDVVFKHKVRGGPRLSMGCLGCHRFHNKGWCFSDCDNAASHCVLTGEDFRKFNGRIKALRGE